MNKELETWLILRLDSPIEKVIEYGPYAEDADDVSSYTWHWAEQPDEIENLGPVDTGFCFNQLNNVTKGLVKEILVQMSEACTRVLWTLTTNRPLYWLRRIQEITPIVDSFLQDSELWVLTGREAHDLMCPVPNLKGLRHSVDGTIWLPRQNRQAETILDQMLIRKPKQLVWRRPIAPHQSIEMLRDRHPGSLAVFVGKGPSLDNLRPIDLPLGQVIFGINEASDNLGVVDNIVYHIQQDTEVTVKNKYPKILHLRNQHKYTGEQYVFDEEALNSKTAFTTFHAMTIAKIMGCDRFEMLCYDACTTGSIAYAECIGHQPGVHQRLKRGAEMFYSFKETMLKHAIDLGIKMRFTMPKGHSST